MPRERRSSGSKGLRSTDRRTVGDLRRKRKLERSLENNRSLRSWTGIDGPVMYVNPSVCRLHQESMSRVSALCHSSYFYGNRRHSDDTSLFSPDLLSDYHSTRTENRMRAEGNLEVTVPCLLEK
ncbi:hypothetical protein J6590_013273 [Homalodisca vitripennis]|nr:hypothetical protein J6590_013273 [Homalodisca vitripennis]